MIKVDELRPGTRIRTSFGVWVATAAAGAQRWEHEQDSVTTDDHQVQRWIDNAQAEVLQ